MLCLRKERISSFMLNSHKPCTYIHFHWGDEIIGSAISHIQYECSGRIPCSGYGFCFSQCKKDINTFQKRKNINFFMKNSFNSSRTPDVTYFYWFHHYPIYVLYPACHCYLNFHTIFILSCLQSPYFLWCQKITFWQCLIKHITESFWCSELIHTSYSISTYPYELGSRYEFFISYPWK